MIGTGKLPSSNSAGPALDLNFRLLYVALRERLWIVAACTVFAVLVAAVYVYRSPKIYSAVTVVQVETSDKNIANVPDPNSAGDLDKLETLKTIEFSLGRRDLMLRLVKDLKLQGADLGLPGNRDWSADDLTDALSRKVTVALMRGTRLIGVEVQLTDPQRAAELANGMVNQYLKSIFEQRVSSTGQANEFLLQEADRLRTKLENSEKELQNYKEQNQAVSLEESQNIIVAQLKDLTAKVTEAKGDRMKLEAASAQLRNLENGPIDQLLSMPQVSNASGVVEQQRQLAALEAEYAKLNERYLELHPKLIQAKGQLEQTRQNLRTAVAEAAKALVAQYEASRETERKYEEALKAQESKALELNRSAIRYNSLAREVASDSAMFDAVLRRVKETAVTKGIEPGIIRIVQPAIVPRYPIKPRKMLILAAALAGGVGLGIAVALALWAFDSSFRTVDQVEGLLRYTVLTALPHVRGASRGSDPGRASATHASQTHAVAEGFRTLRTHLALRDTPPRVILITSAIPGEGKSFSTVNHAISAAAGGSSVLVIDADLRRPKIERSFFSANAGSASPRPGLSNLLRGHATFADAVQTAGFENLSVLTAGHPVEDPGQLLIGPALADILKEASEKYQIVLIDSAPLNAVSDALLVAKHVQAVCLVVRAGHTPRRAVSRAVRLLEEIQAPLAGIILNDLPERGGYFYHYGTELTEEPPAIVPAVSKS